MYSLYIFNETFTNGYTLDTLDLGLNVIPSLYTLFSYLAGLSLTLLNTLFSYLGDLSLTLLYHVLNLVFFSTVITLELSNVFFAIDWNIYLQGGNKGAGLDNIKNSILIKLWAQMSFNQTRDPQNQLDIYSHWLQGHSLNAEERMYLVRYSAYYTGYCVRNNQLSITSNPTSTVHSTNYLMWQVYKGPKF